MITEEKKDQLDNIETKDLIERGIETQEQSKDLYDELRYIKFILMRRMKQSGASILAHPTIVCKGKKDNTSWDYGKLASVRELLDPEDIKLFYVPEHEDTIIVKEKYDMRVGNGFKKYGGEVKAAIEGATIEGEIKDIELKRKD